MESSRSWPGRPGPLPEPPSEAPFDGSVPASRRRCAAPCSPGPRNVPRRVPSARSAASRSSAALVPALPAADAGLLLASAKAGELVAGEGGYAPAGAGVLGDEQAALAEQILVRLAAEPMAPPTLAVLAEGLRRPPRELGQILDVLARRGDVVRVDKDLWFARGAVGGAREVLLGQLEGGGEVTLAGFRDAAGCGRRNAQALLEYFDREGLTLRRGDVRVAAGAAPDRRTGSPAAAFGGRGPRSPLAEHRHLVAPAAFGQVHRPVRLVQEVLERSASLDSTRRCRYSP